MGLFEVLKDTTDLTMKKTRELLQNYFSEHTGITGTSSQMGHIKLSDTYTSKVTDGAAENGMAASQNALYNVYNLLSANLQHRLKYIPINEIYTLLCVQDTRFISSTINQIKPMAIIVAGVFINCPDSAQQHIVFSTAVGSSAVFYWRADINKEIQFSVKFNLSTGEILCDNRYDMGVMQHLILSVAGALTI